MAFKKRGEVPTTTGGTKVTNKKDKKKKSGCCWYKSIYWNQIYKYKQLYIPFASLIGLGGVELMSPNW